MSDDEMKKRLAQFGISLMPPLIDSLTPEQRVEALEAIRLEMNELITKIQKAHAAICPMPHKVGPRRKRLR